MPNPPKAPRIPRASLTAELLRAAVTYHPETGEFTHVATTRGRGVAGASAGGAPVGEDGYRKINIGDVVYLAHRVAWLWMTGEWPKSEIDHQDMDRGNNRWSNLREATRTQNGSNCGRRAHNTTGWKGVYRTPHGTPWRAAISVEKHQKHLGTFDCPAAAHFAYAVAAAKTFGEFARIS
jgi:hypothetical protein